MDPAEPGKPMGRPTNARVAKRFRPEPQKQTLVKPGRPGAHLMAKKVAIELSTRRFARFTCTGIAVGCCVLYAASVYNQKKQLAQLMQLEKDYGYDVDEEDLW